ncbi:MAG: nucleotidyltransferase [Oscillospiraceae bacterium]|nr:nucleotidyltransferase [Oscillospiraceae bacterium]
MKKPVLVVMAAGLGSRYGGLKQIAPVDKNGHILMDYAIYDAKRAGFETVVCVISPEMEREFMEVVGNRIGGMMELRIAFQRLDMLPHGFTPPTGRTKPWGTAHAVYSAKSLVDGPFATINADDYYGAEAFCSIYDFLTRKPDARRHAMVGYLIGNTLTEHGHVARGVCKTNGGELLEIIENTHIEKCGDGAVSIQGGDERVFLPKDTIVSMNMWGFARSMMDEIEARFAGFLTESLPGNPLKCEYFLPLVPNALLREGKVKISVLETSEIWYGVTYAQDMPVVREALAKMRLGGKYPRENHA